MTVRRGRLELDANVRRTDNGTALLGGSPFRLVRLSSSGARILDAWLSGVSVEPTPQAHTLRDRLIAAAMVHPVPVAGAGSCSVGFVVPVHADAEGLARLLPALRAGFPDACVIVVDDASPDRGSIEVIAHRYGAQVLRRRINGGPGAARNTGWRHLGADDRTAADVVVFIDADVEPGAGAFDLVLAHFEDENVTAVAPRVRARPGRSALDAYESCNSPLDMGPAPARVQPRSRVSYVPSAALAVRSAALVSSGGFDETMRAGEDVDLVWRLCADAATVRYEPAAVVWHRNRANCRALARQRFTYARSAAELAARHGDDVAPVELSPAMLAGWTAVIFGGRRTRLLAIATALAGAVALARKLDGKLDHPVSEAARLTVLGHLASARWLANAMTRSWFPMALATRPTRRALAVSLLVPALVRWARQRPALDPAAFVAWSALDDVSYCAGVWAGAWRRRSPAALRPRLRVRHAAGGGDRER